MPCWSWSRLGCWTSCWTRSRFWCWSLCRIGSRAVARIRSRFRRWMPCWSWSGVGRWASCWTRSRFWCWSLCRIGSRAVARIRSRFRCWVRCWRWSGYGCWTSCWTRSRLWRWSHCGIWCWAVRGAWCWSWRWCGCGILGWKRSWWLCWIVRGRRCGALSWRWRRIASCRNRRVWARQLRLHGWCRCWVARRQDSWVWCAKPIHRRWSTIHPASTWIFFQTNTDRRIIQTVRFLLCAHFEDDVCRDTRSELDSRCKWGRVDVQSSQHLRGTTLTTIGLHNSYPVPFLENACIVILGSVENHKSITDLQQYKLARVHLAHVSKRHQSARK